MIEVSTWTDPIEAATAFQEARPIRREPRRSIVRLVEHSCFPRTGAHGAIVVGFTRDLSASGMCLSSERAVAVGSLRRVTLHSVDGASQRTWIARVTRCDLDSRGKHWLGLELLPNEPAATALAARPRLRAVRPRSASGRSSVA